jgi:regulatory protein
MYDPVLMTWRGPKAPPDPTPGAATTAALLLLGRRELSAHQLRERLRRKGFPDSVIDEALVRLRATGALDDSRAAAAKARHDLVIHRHGRSRVLRQVQAMGVDSETARGAVSAAFGEVNEDQLLEDALTRRLRGAPFPTERGAVNRLQGWLLRQGFDSDKVRQLLRRRSRSEDT